MAAADDRGDAEGLTRRVVTTIGLQAGSVAFAEIEGTVHLAVVVDLAVVAEVGAVRTIDGSATRP
ncbi:hypothetical protein AB0K52_05380 [Glycomyces sp. NPDC049804]|uniref:hypothetical protein n=1 Tax=Glycomyces sp. NPDC049804 TaxID=3154363 RepID=UPI003435F6FE